MRLIIYLTFILLAPLVFAADPSQDQSADTAATSIDNTNKVYRTRDANGTTVFTDKGTENAVEVHIPAPITYTPERSNRSSAGLISPEAPALSTAYKTLTITSPETQTALRSNPGNIQISFMMEPRLQANHSLQLMVDGSLTKTQKNTAPFMLTNLDRGTHNFQIQIIEDSSGDVLQSSQNVSVTLLRYSVQNRRAN